MNNLSISAKLAEEITFKELTSDPAICEDLKARVLYLKQLFPAPVRSKSNAG